jgi:hypothetical protein
MDCFDLSSFSFFIRTRTQLLRTLDLRESRRRSPLAPSLLSSTLPLLVMLQRIVAANQGTSLNIHSKNFISQCNCNETMSKFYATKAIKTFSLKKHHPPPPCRFAWKFWGKLKKFYWYSVVLIIYAFGKFSRVSKLQILWRKSTKFVCEFCGLDPLGILALVDTSTLSCFNHDFLRIFTRAPCPFIGTYSSRKIFMNLCQEILKQPTHTFAWLQSALIIMMETQATTHCCLEPFRWESLWQWDLGHNLLLPQAFRWESLWRWDLGHNLLLPRAFSVGIPLTVGFRLSRCLWLSRSLFHKLFLFSQ